MKKKCEILIEGVKLKENETLLNRIYTQLYIIEGESEGVNEEHEVLLMEQTARTQYSQDIPIYCNDIFKASPEPGCEEKDQIKTVVTKGIAGIGKTLCRKLNLIRDHQYSLHRLLLDFHPELQDQIYEIYEECKVVFIFDGLDESRITSDAPDAQKVSAANQMQHQQHQASRIISHIRRARSLHIIPVFSVFCWISSTVLQKLLEEDLSAEIPQTLTEMYIHFLLIQINMRNQKYEERDPEKLLQSNREVIVKLAEVAFKQLMKGNVMFYEEDLIESGIDLTDASVYSGICTEIFKQESVIHQRKVYSFIHLSVQEFLTAFHVFYCYLMKNKEPLEFLDKRFKQHSLNKDSLYDLLTSAVDEALESKNGELDLFLRFLLGVSLESNQSLLQDLL
ncbi:protein NLRC3-like, partial [Sinocyclocheilus rhinocerous]|uniref:protein NLRC3-like n=1 Tax=Sinocyclocheilus rhinocerous TaxID=307959 RepID=UPI0007B96DEC